jgi:apolipoprotein N-acyltransferase
MNSNKKHFISNNKTEQRRSRNFFILLSLLTGIFISLAFPPSPYGVFACFGLIPLLLLIEYASGYARPLRYTYLTFFIIQVLTVYWMGGFVHGKHPMQMVGGGLLLFAHPFFFFIPVLGYLVIRRTFGLTPALLALPFIWVGFEYIHSIGDLAFPWHTLGNTQTYDQARIQYIEFTGVYGLSFWIVSLNVIGFILFHKIALRKWKAISIPSIFTGLSIIILHLIPMIYGSVVLNNQQEFKEFVRIGIIQPDTDPFEKWESDRQMILDQLISQSESILPDSPDLIVLPENAVPFYLLLPQNRYYLWQLREFIDSAGVPILTGLPHAIFYSGNEGPATAKVIPETGEKYASFNSAILLSPSGDEYQFYGKIVLVPFVEKIPFSDMFDFAVKIRRNIGVGGWDVGPDTTIFFFDKYTENEDIERINFGTVICYESVYPGFVGHLPRRGADFLLVITNDSWWGRTPGPRQHHQFSILRAIENRRSVARSANGGISSFIDPYGNILYETKLFTRTQVVHEIPIVHDITFYSKHGDVFAKGCLLLGILPVVASLGERMRKKLFEIQDRYRNETNRSTK